jgi:glycosyltransferase involved in cell wall biosynthesis
VRSGLITMITICRNAEVTIARTIKSVGDQLFPQLEYIVIDGASTDSTANIVRSYGKMIDIFVSEPDDGIADAFNKGIARASGDIIGFINADDQLLPGTLDKVRDFFAARPDVDVLHGDVLLYEGSHLIKRIRPAGRWWYPWRLVLFNHPATFVRKSVYEQYGLFDTSYRIAMDVEIFLRWLRKGVNIAYLPDPLVAMQAGGLSGRSALQGYREVKRALSTYRFPSLPVTIQYISRFGLQLVVIVQEKLRMLKRAT